MAEKHRTRLDRTFDKFVKLIESKRPDNGGTLLFRGVSLKVSFTPGLQGLLKATINNTAYDLQDNLLNKASLASAGLLGHDLRPLGDRCLQAVHERLHRDKVRRAYGHVKELYGANARKVWTFRDPQRSLLKSPKLAQAVLALLQYLEGHSTIPSSVAACRKAGISFRFLTTQEWKLVQRLTTYLGKEGGGNAGKSRRQAEGPLPSPEGGGRPQDAPRNAPQL